MSSSQIPIITDATPASSHTHAHTRALAHCSPSRPPARKHASSHSQHAVDLHRCASEASINMRRVPRYAQLDTRTERSSFYHLYAADSMNDMHCCICMESVSSDVCTIFLLHVRDGCVHGTIVLLCLEWWKRCRILITTSMRSWWSPSRVPVCCPSACSAPRVPCTRRVRSCYPCRS
jgi:hypothetical protein